MASTTAETSHTDPAAAELVTVALRAGTPPRKAIRASRGIAVAVFLGVIVWLAFGLAVWALVGHLAAFSF